MPPEITSVIASGPGTGTESVQILDPDSIKNDDTYRIVFKDNSVFHTDPAPYYEVINYSNNDTLIHFTQFMSNQIMTPVIDGLTIGLNNDTSVTIDQNKSGWQTGSSNYIVQLGFDPRYSNSYAGQRVNLPADFQITFTQPGRGDTSYPTSVFAQPIPSNVIIKDVTDNIPHMQFMFFDNNNDQQFDAGDAIFIIAGDSISGRVSSNLNRHVGWSISMFQDTSIAADRQKAPQPGDVYQIATTKPFRTGEYYQFTTKASYFDRTKFQQDMNDIAVVPNPYPGAASWEPATQQVGRGERLVYFIHLPSVCTIRIFTISGHLVQTLHHQSNLSDGQEPWNLVSKDGMSISFGVYVYVVESQLGNKIGRFAIIK